MKRISTHCLNLSVFMLYLFYRYGAVVRGPNAYVPPARRHNSSTVVTPTSAISPAPKDKESEADGQEKSDTSVPVPTVSVNTPDGREKTLSRGAPSAPGTGATKVRQIASDRLCGI